MERVLFDTNVYGFLLEEPDATIITDKILVKDQFTVYGYPRVRKEIRAIPRTPTASRKARIAILRLYDIITNKHIIHENEVILALAKKFWKRYNNLGGVHGWHTSIQNDFILVAAACIHRLDIIYLEDKKSLRHRIVRDACHTICMKENLRLPSLLSYHDLLKKFRTLF